MLLTKAMKCILWSSSIFHGFNYRKLTASHVGTLLKLCGEMGEVGMTSAFFVCVKTIADLRSTFLTIIFSLQPFFAEIFQDSPFSSFHLWKGYWKGSHTEHTYNLWCVFSNLGSNLTAWKISVKNLFTLHMKLWDLPAFCRGLCELRFPGFCVSRKPQKTYIEGVSFNYLIYSSLACWRRVTTLR